MNWFDSIDAFFSPGPVLSIVIVLLFSTPLIRSFSHAFTRSDSLSVRISKPFGIFEEAAAAVRGWIAVPYLVLFIAWNVYRAARFGFDQAVPGKILLSLTGAVLIASHFFFRVWKRNARLALAEFAQKNPTMHPQEFYDYFYSSQGCLRISLPSAPYRTINPRHLDFRRSNGNSTGSIWPMLLSILDITALARMFFLVLRTNGEGSARKAVSAFALILATRVSQRTQSQVVLEGIDKLADVRMPMIYCCNHTSAFDFPLLPLVLYAHASSANIDVPFIPCFLLARDHFLDNPFLYRAVGLGRAAEVMKMVFVERKKRSEETRNMAITQAAERLILGSAPVAIFPQGSRARSRVNSEGERFDASYYAVGSRERLKQEGGHIKKGAAFIAIETVSQLASKDMGSKVSLVPIIFAGAANVVSRKGIRVQKNMSVTLRIGDPIAVGAEEVSPVLASNAPESRAKLAADISNEIDTALKTTYRVHAELERRFFEDIRGMLNPMKTEEISIAMKQWRKDDNLVYVILDFIYACEPKEWNSLLGQLIHLILNDAPREDFQALRERIADILSN